jgi:REP element-mobilizing transposase RayT
MFVSHGRLYVSIMPRRHRNYQPGAIFHLTARTLGREKWFDQHMRDRIVDIIRSAQLRSDAKLLAYVVMTNHLHLLIQQGSNPLSKLMQPICRRIALLVQLEQNRCGYIFERRFRDHTCRTPARVRRTIAYIHYNPVEARLCASPEQWRWSSHDVYAGVGGLPSDRPTVVPLLGLFASQADASQRELRSDYLGYTRWRSECRALLPGDPRPPAPDTRAGDWFWLERYGHIPTIDRRVQSRRDLRDIVLRSIDQLAPGLTQEELITRRGGPAVVAVRRQVVYSALAVGYTGADVARYLKITDGAVSRIAARRFRSEAFLEGTKVNK